LTNTDFAALVRKEDAERRSLSEARIGAQRINIELIEHLRFRASFGKYNFTSMSLQRGAGLALGFHRFRSSWLARRHA
jgi:3-deoxy-D-manno-octulosonic acid (KDO) 8-phosphate synthase